MRHHRPALLLVLLLVLAGVACTPRDMAVSSCLDASNTIIDAPPTNVGRWPSQSLWIPDGATVDARGSTFEDSVFDANGYAVAIKFHEITGSRNDLCVVGGTVFSTLDPEHTLWSSWHKHYGMIVLRPGYEIVGTQFRNQGDMIVFGPNAADWSVIGVRTDGDGPGGGGPGGSGYIHDDCIENDAMHGGLVDDSKLDGCNIFLSSQGEPIDGSANTVEVRDTLVRLRPYHESYDVAKYGNDQIGGFFKWGNGGASGTPPQLYVHDSVFRADQRAYYGGNVNGFLGLPPGTTCHDVTLVGTEAWPAADLASWTSQCTNLTLGSAADWDAAVAAWDAAHPTL